MRSNQSELLLSPQPRLRRRRFLAQLPGVLLPFMIGCRRAGQRLRIAAIGAGGKGASDIECCDSEEVVAICDVDQNLAAAALKAHPRAKFYFDWRELFDRESHNFDAVLISTPDHQHAIIASHALKLTKHVYCQKPLAQTLHEIVYLRELAKNNRVVTQMGNQGSAAGSFRRAVELLQAGIIGPLTQVYAWSDRPIWPQGIRHPAQANPVPRGFQWDNWLGPAPARRFHNGTYHPFNWRGWFEYGTGALGDMGCHLLNLPFRAARLGCPQAVEPLRETDSNPDSYPTTSKIKFSFPARNGLPPTELWWSDGLKAETAAGLLPAGFSSDMLTLLGKVPESGCLLVGAGGVAFSPGDYGERVFLKLNGETEFADATSHHAGRKVSESIPRIGKRGYSDLKHHFEWISACKGGQPTYSSFENAFGLTQIVLLGCVALRVNVPITCDSSTTEMSNPPAALDLIKREYRQSWELA